MTTIRKRDGKDLVKTTQSTLCSKGIFCNKISKQMDVKID